MAHPSQLDADSLVWKVRHAVYQHLARTTGAPTVTELADRLGQPSPLIEDTLRQLANEHHALALAPSSATIWMAWPFSAIPTLYPVDTLKGTYWANCAWDALSIPPLVGLDANTTYTCSDGCGATIPISIKDGAVAPTDAVVHFAVSPRQFWDNVAYT